MENNEWITDRLPTLNDTHGTCDCVWVTWSPGDCGQRRWSSVEKDQPWQPLTKPAPYVKSERWRVEIATVVDCRDPSKPVAKAPDSYAVSDVTYSHWLPIGFTREAAERICDIYNEVLP